MPAQVVLTVQVDQYRLARTQLLHRPIKRIVAGSIPGHGNGQGACSIDISNAEVEVLDECGSVRCDRRMRVSNRVEQGR